MEKKGYNFMINERKTFEQPVKNDARTYDNIYKITTGQENDYTTGCFLDYFNFKKYYEMIAKDLDKLKGIKINQFYWKSRFSRKYDNVFHY